MYTHPSLTICFALLLGVLLLASQVTASLLDAYAVVPVLKLGSRTDPVIDKLFLSLLMYRPGS